MLQYNAIKLFSSSASLQQQLPIAGHLKTGEQLVNSSETTAEDEEEQEKISNLINVAANITTGGLCFSPRARCLLCLETESKIERGTRILALSRTFLCCASNFFFFPISGTWGAEYRIYLFKWEQAASQCSSLDRTYLISTRQPTGEETRIDTRMRINGCQAVVLFAASKQPTSPWSSWA